MVELKVIRGYSGHSCSMYLPNIIVIFQIFVIRGAMPSDWLSLF